MGLPGSGKTTLANELANKLSCNVLNADAVRSEYNDWDFSNEGRVRQAYRMSNLSSKQFNDDKEFVIADFVCPTEETREAYNPDIVVWVDTIILSRYEDTNKIFTPPSRYDFRITDQNASKWADVIFQSITEGYSPTLFDWKKPTAQMLGRYQPWHEGHRNLFKEMLDRVGQVCIMVRDTGGTDNSNPYNFEEIQYNIKRDLDPMYLGKYEVLKVPNITNIFYGRDVGYSIEKINLDPTTESISATKIRNRNSQYMDKFTLGMTQ